MQRSTCAPKTDIDPNELSTLNNNNNNDSNNKIAIAIATTIILAIVFVNVSGPIRKGTPDVLKP